MKKASFCISYDVELLWGRKNETNIESFKPLAIKTRKIIPQLIKLHHDLEVPATWAIVGKLIDKKNKQKDKQYYFPEIVELLKKDPSQEIACHSYEHINYDVLDENSAKRDIDNCLSVAKQYRLQLKSFVYPQNNIAHVGVLRKAGFTSYRGINPDEIAKERTLVHKLISFSNLFVPMQSLVTKPKKNGDIANIPATFYFVSARGKRKYIPQGSRYKAAKRGIDEAIKHNALFHIWAHPIDFSVDTKKLMRELEEILKYAKSQEEKGNLEILTMKKLSAY